MSCNIDDLVTMDDAARECGMSYAVWMRHTRAGDVQTVKPGHREKFVTRTELERFKRTLES